MAETAKHPFSADDWATLHSAQATAVSPDGKTILYEVAFGATKGRTTTEWHTIHPDGSGQNKLELPADFHPAGFTADGNGLYGAYKINKLDQFAIFQLKGLTAQSVPQITVLLPRGIQAALPSPNGTEYALLADPRPPDSLAETRMLIEPDQTSIYMVKSDGTAGQWWCGDLKNVSGGAFDLLGNPPIAWSPNGSTLAVLSTTPKIGYHYVRSWIDTCSASGSHRIAQIDNFAAGIAWINHGNDLAFLSTHNNVLTSDEVFTVSASGGQPANQTPNLDGTAEALSADPHGHVWVSVDHGVHLEVNEFRNSALVPAYQWQDGFIAGPPVFSPYASSTDQLAFTVDDPAHAENVALPQSGGLHKITKEGDDELAKIDLGPVRDVHWISKEGINLDGIATFPAG